MMVCEFLREVRSSSTVRFAEKVEIWHIDENRTYITNWKNLGFAASYTLCEFHVNDQQEIDAISVKR